jgi:translation initiation factor IF-1
VAGRDVVEVTGTVVELLPRALCRVGVDGHGDVIAHAAAGVERNFVRLIVGDRVLVSSRLATRGAVGSSGGSPRPDRGHGDEGQSIGQAHLRQVQDRSPRTGRPGDLHEHEAQAASGVTTWHESQASICRAPSASRSG